MVAEPVDFASYRADPSSIPAAFARAAARGYRIVLRVRRFCTAFGAFLGIGKRALRRFGRLLWRSAVDPDASVFERDIRLAGFSLAATALCGMLRDLLGHPFDRGLYTAAPVEETDAAACRAAARGGGCRSFPTAPTRVDFASVCVRNRMDLCGLRADRSALPARHCAAGYDLNDVVCVMENADERKEEIIDAISAVNFGKKPVRFNGKEI